MVRKIVASTVSAALCLAPVTPALAQSNNLTAVQAPMGATGTVNLRIPLGAGANVEEPSYGLTLGYGQVVGADAAGNMLTREMRVADIRFNSDGFLRKANVASFDLANLDRDSRFDELTGGGNTLWLVVGAVAAGAAVCLLIADCFDGDEDN